MSGGLYPQTNSYCIRSYSRVGATKASHLTLHKTNRQMQACPKEGLAFLQLPGNKGTIRQGNHFRQDLHCNGTTPREPINIGPKGASHFLRGSARERLKPFLTWSSPKVRSPTQQRLRTSDSVDPASPMPPSIFMDLGFGESAFQLELAETRMSHSQNPVLKWP